MQLRFNSTATYAISTVSRRAAVSSCYLSRGAGENRGASTPELRFGLEQSPSGIYRREFSVSWTKKHHCSLTRTTSIKLGPNSTRHSAGLIPHHTAAKMSTATSHPAAPAGPLDSEANIDRLINFWFQTIDVPAEIWFRSTPEFDRQCTEQFSDLVQAARTKQLDGWRSSARGTLALILLLDQLPRNIYRESAESLASDAKAVEVSTRALLDGLHLQLRPLEQAFMMMPLMHDETFIGHLAVSALLEVTIARLKAQSSPGEGVKAATSIEGGKAAPPTVEADKMPGVLGFMNMGVLAEKSHLEVLNRFGRYPSRNKLLGRETTAEEEEFLKEHPSGFPGF